MADKTKGHLIKTSIDDYMSFYERIYLKNVMWLPIFEKGNHMVTIDGTILKGYTLYYIVLEAATDAWYKHECLCSVKEGTDTANAKEQFMDYCQFETSNVFAKIWLDKWIDNLAISMYNKKYRQVLDTVRNLCENPVEVADKAAKNYMNDFLRPLQTEVTPKCVDFSPLLWSLA